MSLFRVARFALPVLALSGIMTATAAADDHRLYFSSERSNQLPGCDATSVQRAVQNTVSRAPSYFNGVRIVQLDKIRDTTFRAKYLQRCDPPLLQWDCEPVGRQQGRSNICWKLMRACSGSAGMSKHV
jgi:hypothetical protein